MTRHVDLSGIWVVLVTPFTPSGDIDEASLRQEIRWILSQPVKGVVAFGLASEVYTLTDSERAHILKIVASECQGKPWIAGAEHTGTRVAALRARDAFQIGAVAVMAYPPYLVKPSETDVMDYYRALSDSGALPVVVQDAQPWTGVPLSVRLLSSIREFVSAVKIETPPTGFKLTALREVAPSLTILGGSGGLYAYDELQRGVDGFLIGPLQGAPYVRLRQLWDRGRADEAAVLYTNLLPGLLTSMATLDTYIRLQKEGLRQQGIITHAGCRAPHQPLDQWQWRLAERWSGILAQ